MPESQLADGPLASSRAEPEYAPGKVSFLVPAFGSLNPDALYLVLSSIQRQEYPHKEALVAEEHLGEPRFEAVAREANARYIAHNVSGIGGNFSVARARNLGLAISDAEFVVMQDADIVLHSRNFIEGLVVELMEHPGFFMATTPLLHLQRREISEWKAEFLRTGDFDSYPGRCLCYEEYVLSALPYGDNDFRVVPHPYNEAKRDRRYVALKELHEDYLRGPERWKGSEPIIFTPCVAKGFIAARREHFLAAGGYCERYIGWGCEDGDLKWKLSNFLKCKNLQGDRRFAGVHLDHDRPYFSAQGYLNAKGTSNGRQRLGFVDAVKDDLSHRSLLAEKLRNKLMK